MMPTVHRPMTSEEGARRARGDRLPEAERFWAMVDKGDGSGCWLWTGGTVGRPGGGDYGSFKAWVDGRWRTVRANRYAYELVVGPIPDGLVVRHTCDTPECVRPDHLLLGTHADNIADRDARGRGRAPQGEDNGHARLTAADIPRIHDLLAGGLSQREVGMRVGVHQSQVSRIIRGRAWQSVTSDRAMATATSDEGVI
jgi:hypothetical protein